MTGFLLTGSMLKAGKKSLLAINAVLWAIPGVIISTKGILAYSTTVAGCNKILYLIAGSLLTLVFFLFIFSKITKKYTDRILRLPDEKNSVFMIMNLKGYIMFAFMITLGIVLKSIHTVPIEFFAFFYCGLGPALLYAAMKFCCKIKTLAQ